MSAALRIRALLAHLVAIAGGWVAALVASDHFLQALPHWEAFVIGGGAALFAGVVRTSELEALPRWWGAFAIGIAIAAGAATVYLDLRGAVPVYELILPMIPASILMIAIDRAMTRRGL